MKDRDYLPHYDHNTRCWKVDFPDRDTEEGDLLYVASEFARTSLIFPYNTTATADKEFHGHAHSFDGVIQAFWVIRTVLLSADLRITTPSRSASFSKPFQNGSNP